MMDRRAAVVLLALLLGAACEGPSEALAPSAVLPESAPVAHASRDWDEQLRAERLVAATQPRFAPRIDEGGIALAASPTLAAFVSSDGVALSIGHYEVRFEAIAMGRDATLAALPTGTQGQIAGPEVRVARGPRLSEWWRSLPSGLEHGLTVSERPAGRGTLVIAIAVEGALHARAATDDLVDLVDADGRVVATYAHLVVRDAAGTDVRASLGIDDTSDVARIVVRIEDDAARYPIEIDPLIATHDATLVAGDAAAGDRLGNAVAISADGTRAFAAAPADTTTAGAFAGSVRVFVRAGAVWTEEATLVRVPGVPSEYFGTQLSVSADGSRALISSSSNYTDSAVYVRSGSVWSVEATLVPPVGVPSSRGSVALARDGTRAVVGAGDNAALGTRVGAAYVYLRSGSTWAVEATLYPVDGVPEDRFGDQVAISGDGSRVVVGVPVHRSFGRYDSGAAYIYARRGTSWSIEAVLTAPDLPASMSARFGSAVDLTGDGTRAVIEASGSGIQRVFVRSGTRWTEEAQIPTAYGATAISDDGLRILVGTPNLAPGGRTGAGGATLYARVGSTWSSAASLLAPDGLANDALGDAVALTGNGAIAMLGAAGDDTPLNGAGSARIFSIPLAPSGDPCVVGAACASGFCVDGFCCASSCGGGSAGDCQACSATLTGGTNGICAPLSAALAPTVTCRPAGAPCDAPEVCTASSTACPPDAVRAVGSVCRPILGVCDVVELCDGVSAACPTDAFAATGVCRPAISACDVPESCSGSSRACPPNVAGVAGVECRPATGPCDGAEVCDGVSPACPGDRVAPAGNVCRAAAGPCDVSEVCDGASAICPADLVAEVGVVCQAASATNPCDSADVCDGVTAGCRPRFAPATLVCAPAGGDVCDAPDHCAGTSADCVPTYASGVVCRPAVGSCDRAESCSGSSPSCPPDIVSPASVSCRASTDTACDPEEVCDGVATACPPDVTSCVPHDAGVLPDAGTDAGADGGADVGVEAGAARDGGMAPVPPAAAACACRAGGSSRSAPLWIAMYACGLLGARRRTRRRTGAHGERRW